MITVETLSVGFPYKPLNGCFGYATICLIHGNKNILFDVGGYQLRSVVLGKLEEIDAVVISHLHFDHCSNLDLFIDTDIPIYISEKELLFYDKYKDRDSDLFSYFDIESTNVLLGSREYYSWVPFGIYDDNYEIICNSIFRNIGNLEAYSYDAETKSGVVYRHSYSTESKKFIWTVQMMIENELNKRISINNSIKKIENIKGLFSFNGYQEVCDIIPEAIRMVIDSVAPYNGFERIY